MDQGVEKVPDEEDAELGWCKTMEDAERSSVCCDEDREGCEEGENGCTVDYQGGGRRLGLHVHEWLRGRSLLEVSSLVTSSLHLPQDVPIFCQLQLARLKTSTISLSK